VTGNGAVFSPNPQSPVTNPQSLTLVTGYVNICFMIKSFGDRETEKLFNREFSRRLPPEIHHCARLKLEVLDAAEAVADLRIPPSNHLEMLSGDRQGQYSIRINSQWRICFVWRDGDAYEVEITDYY
jgi:toxin HigB-1